jgi:NAD(P)-dependent dehydrogenase (short-subunit alcohol dehydrogenase family)
MATASPAPCPNQPLARPDPCRRAVEKILRDVPWAKVTPMHCDLASQASIRTFVAEFNALGRPLHLLINNAGLLNPSPMFQLSEDQIELTLAVNYFGPCYLTLLLQVGAWG